MSLSHSPSVVTNGLVLYYDMANTQKSWKGAPATNLLTYSQTFASWSKFDTTVTNGVVIAPDGTLTGSILVPTAVSIGHGMTIYGGRGIGTFTFSVYAKQGGYPRLGMRVYDGAAYQMYATFDISNGTIVTSPAGTATITPVGDGWYRCTCTGTSASGNMGATTGFVIESLPAANTVQQAFVGDGSSGAYVWGAQLEAGSYATPYIPTTTTSASRSNTQAIVDLTNNNTVTATSLTYASNNTFSFNGTSDRIISSTTNFNRTTGQELTVSCWVNPSRLSGQYQIICESRSENAATLNWAVYQHATDGAISFHGSAQNKSSYIPSTSAWVFVTNTVTTAGVSTLYVNGVSNSVVTGYTYGGTPSYFSIGANGNGTEPFLGSIPNVQIYNRTLSASEVLQNFNALRGRYGL
jgi:hypothetical protein